MFGGLMMCQSVSMRWYSKIQQGMRLLSSVLYSKKIEWPTWRNRVILDGEPIQALDCGSRSVTQSFPLVASNPVCHRVVVLNICLYVRYMINFAFKNTCLCFEQIIL